MHLSLFVVTLLCLINRAACYFPQFLVTRQRLSLKVYGVPTPSMDGELNKFFEAAARSGAPKFKTMLPEDRVEYTTRAIALEEDIFDIRDRIGELESIAIEGGKLDIDLIKQLRDEMSSLKQDYIDLVGSNDLPIYFGKNIADEVPDSYQ